MATKELIEIQYDQSCTQPLALCLGFFDSLHMGHRELFTQARLSAIKRHARSAVFTFDNNPLQVLGKVGLQVLSYEERLYRLGQCEIEYVLRAHFDPVFSRLSPEEFLDRLFGNKNVVSVTVGSDYTFGAKAAGKIEDLRAYCDRSCIELFVIDLKKSDNGDKISSRTLRELIKSGSVEEIADQLGAPYFLIGEVKHGRGEGRAFLYPTANIDYPSEKEKLAQGVYFTRVTVDGVPLRAVTNVGTHPTVNDASYNVESYLLHYDEDLYGKRLIVEFYRKLRDVKAFENVAALKEAICADVRYVDQLRGNL